MGEFTPVWHHRMKYFLSPQLDLYRNISRKFAAAERVLDYGCGTGFGTVQFCGTPCGIDCDAEAIHFAQEVLGSCATFVCDDWTGAQNVSPGYDLAVCIEVIEHTDNPGRILERLRQCVRPGGSVVVSTKNRNSGYRKNRGHSAEYSRKEFGLLVAGAFPNDLVFTDYTLRRDLQEHVTPMVAIWKKPDA